MTKNHRFAMYQNTIYDNGKIINSFECMKLLNKLNDENEQLKSENNMLKVTIGRNEAYIKRLTETSEWHC